MSDVWSDPLCTSVLRVCEQRRKFSKMLTTSVHHNKNIIYQIDTCNVNYQFHINTDVVRYVHTLVSVVSTVDSAFHNVHLNDGVTI